jgi:beta-lysine 5,6-aminomutase beta subunit
VVTQRDAHIKNTSEMTAAFRQAGPDRPLLVIGGPRFDPAMAGELGVDKIFGRGTTPRDVASYLVHKLAPPPDHSEECAGGTVPVAAGAGTR